MLKRIVLLVSLMALVQCGDTSPARLPPALLGALDAPAFDIGGSAQLAVEADGLTYRAPAYEARFGAGDGSVYLVRAGGSAGVRLTPVSSPLERASGVERAGAVVYPASAQGAAVALSPRPEGVKEDIVLTRPLSDSMLFEWELKLDPGLEARLSDGSIEISSSGRGLYRLPAPVIRQPGGSAPGDAVRFELEGTRLRLVAQGLAGLSYPLSIDPTLLVTTTIDFALGGNAEDSIRISNDQVQRGRITRGVGPWTTASTSFGSGRHGHCTVAYNGYLYVIGGWTGFQPLNNDVRFAPVNANGTLGAWTATTPYPTARANFGCVAYNGYLYLVGGFAGFTTLNDVRAAKINANGTVGTWSLVGSIGGTRDQFGCVAYNGYLYVLGGIFRATGAASNEVLFAPIHGDGTVGTFTATTPFTTPRWGPAAFAANGFMYLLGGGATGSATRYSDTQLAPINPDGTVGAWTSGPSISNACNQLVAFAYNGYAYNVGGTLSSGQPRSSLQMAGLENDGTLGPWQTVAPLAVPRENLAATAYQGFLYVTGGDATLGERSDVVAVSLDENSTAAAWSSTTALVPARSGHASVAFNGVVYALGGHDGTNHLTDVAFSRFSPGGALGVWTATTALPAGRSGHAAFAFGGYLFVLGGTGDTGYLADVLWAPINADGTVGAWSTLASPFPGPRAGHQAVAHNGRVWVIGGEDGAPRADVQTSPLIIGQPLSWTSAGPLPAGRSGHAALAYGGRILVAGGLSAAGRLADVQVAGINADGTLTSWSATSTFTTPRDGLTAASHGGYLYVLGGSTGAAQLADLQAAPLNSDGSVGPFRAATPQFTTQRAAHASVVHDGRLYALGGRSAGAPTGSVSRTQLNPTGTARSWATTAGLTPRAEHATVSAGGRLYVIGGTNGAELAEVRYAAISGTGALGAWAATTPLPSARRAHAAVAHSGAVFVVGGAVGSSTQSEVIAAPINAGGTLGAWAATTTLPGGRSGHAAVASEGFLYVLGGQSGGTRSAEVLAAPITGTGTLGAWSVAPPLPSAREGHAAVAYNGRLYVTGGSDVGLRGDVLMAPLDTGGAVGAWSTIGALPGPLRWHTSVAYNGRLYLLGGGGVAPVMTEVAVAPINADGLLGPWSATLPLPAGRVQHGSALHGGFVYVTGGFSSTYLGDVRVAELDGPAPRGRYTKLVDLGGVAAPLSSMTVNGNGANKGTASLSYRVAPASGVFGPTLSKGRVPFGTAIPLGDSNVRYVWLSFLLDDASSTVVNPDSTGDRDISDITFDFTLDLCAAVTCTPLDQCHLAGTCDPATGLCSNPNRPDGTVCSDANACTQTDSCQAGACVGTNPVTCTAQSQCHTAGTCNPVTGVCSNPARPNGSMCDDSNACTQTDTCQSGTCAGGNPVTCTAQSQCHAAGACDPATGVCTNPVRPDGSMCNDGDACTQSDVCMAGACTGSNPVSCVPTGPCRINAVCLPASGACTETNAPDGTPCPGGTCVSGSCAVADAGAPDGGAPDAGAPDGGAPDGGAPDGGAPDGGAPDAGTPDAGAPDAGAPDAGTPDAGTPDAGTPDAGTADGGAADAGPLDAGEGDAGTVADAGSDAGQPDGGSVADAGQPDAGTAGSNGGAADGGDLDTLTGGCGCSSGGELSLLVLAAGLLSRRRRGTKTPLR